MERESMKGEGVKREEEWEKKKKVF